MTSHVATSWEVPLVHRGIRAAHFLIMVMGMASSGISQDPTGQTRLSSRSIADNSTEPVATFRAATRMVTIEVVAKNLQGRHITGLKAGDFRVFEQSPNKGKQQHEQKIAVFREVRTAEFASALAAASPTPDGVYTNRIIMPEEPVPATIVLVDGLNTELKDQAQVHVQMLRMLRSLPKNSPVAVFLFGSHLSMLQDFTTNPRVLQAALDQALSAAGTGVARLDPRDNPDALANRFEKINTESQSVATSPQRGSVVEEVNRIPQRVIDAVKRFEQDVYAETMDIRVHQTVGSLASIARHVEGYPGRKNLLWISTSFPIYLSPLIDDSGKVISDFTGLEGAGARDYWPQLRRLASVLSDAKVAVYPINPAGVQAPTLFDAGTRVRETSGRATGDSLRRETMMRGNEQDTMQVLAEGTGGQVCTGTNDLGECIQKAFDDGGSFYEIAYYPDSDDWNGEYRRITVRAAQPGLRLAYRQGYYAKAEGAEAAKDQKAELQQAACDDYLNATAISFSAKRMPGASPENLKFYLSIDPTTLSLTPTTSGGRSLKMVVAVCTFDKKGAPFLFMDDHVQREFEANDLPALAARGLPHIVSIPAPKPPSLRLVVMDVPSGRLGSVSIRVEEEAAVSAP